ncbi:hypothetical protein SOVF_055400 [Spinacia oleracea]|nr:hypothetical protein SOVF_055400 [Spinacia oleracea]
MNRSVQNTEPNLHHLLLFQFRNWRKTLEPREATR